MKHSVGAVFVLAIALTACQSNSGGFSKNGGSATGQMGGASVIPPMSSTRFSDVPLPKGSKEDLERSFVYESHSLQIGRMVYKTKHRVSEVAQFYIQEAPQYDWKLISVMQAEGAQLAFEKPGKHMWVTVHRDGFFGRKSTLIVNLIPEDESGNASMQTLR